MVEEDCALKSPKNISESEDRQQRDGEKVPAVLFIVLNFAPGQGMAYSIQLEHGILSSQPTHTTLNKHTALLLRYLSPSMGRLLVVLQILLLWLSTNIMTHIKLAHNTL